MDIVLNLLIFLITVLLVVSFAKKKGKWDPEKWHISQREIQICLKD